MDFIPDHVSTSFPWLFKEVNTYLRYKHKNETSLLSNLDKVPSALITKFIKSYQQN